MKMPDRCYDCVTNDTCDQFGCIHPGRTQDEKLGLETCVHGDSQCKRIGDCAEKCLDKPGNSDDYVDPEIALSDQCVDCITPNQCYDKGCIQDIAECCGDPADCNEDCANNVKLDGRNEGPMNKHGCSYVDCDCAVPCHSKADTKVINININTLNGDINF